jgi:oxygen-dependent protoporphyrinogen oxidase
MSRVPLAIVGGGISGLAAAYECVRRDLPFVLFERAPRPGGVMHTERIDGFTIDAGPDALLTQKPAAIDLCRALGLGDRLQPQTARDTFVVRGGRLRRLPEASVMGIPTRWLPFATTGAFSPLGKLRMAADVVLPAAPPASDESIASFIGRRFGREAVDYLAEPLLAGIHGGDPARLSMRCAFPRFLELERLHRSVIVGLQRAAAVRHSTTTATERPQSKAPAAFATPFVALPGGMTELTGALMRALPSGPMRFGAGVADVRPCDGGFTIALDDGGTTTTSAVLLAAPPPATGRLASRLDSDLAALCARIRMASVVTVALGYKRAAVGHPLRGTGFVVPGREGMHIRAVSWVSSKWASRAPDGMVLLRAFLGGMLHPEAIDLDERELVARAAGESARLLAIDGDPVLARVYRWRDATPQLEVGHLDLMSAIESRLAAHPGVFISASGFRGTGIADCVADGRRQAANAAAFLTSTDLARAI